MYEHIIAKPKKTAEAFIDVTQRLIDACLNDTEVVYVEPLTEELEVITDLSVTEGEE